ncbi:MAG: PH domain-containing protein [Eggerthellaceae bacterium]|nr:PH domain-containing protein [Eggerthellaceae bacterium]
MGLHGYIDKQLTGDEQIIYRAHLSWVPIVGKILTFLLAGIIVCVCLVQFAGQGRVAAYALVAITLLGVLIQLPAIVRNLGVDIVVTDKRLHSKTGLIMVKNDRESSLARVDDTDIDFESIFERLFNYGSIEIRTLGAELIHFDNVAKPRQLKRRINEAKEKYVDVPLAGAMYESPGDEEQTQF